MRRSASIIVSTLVALGLVACSTSPDEDTSKTTQAATTDDTGPLSCAGNDVLVLEYDASDPTGLPELYGNAIYPIAGPDPSNVYALLVGPAGLAYGLYAPVGSAGAKYLSAAHCLTEQIQSQGTGAQQPPTAPKGMAKHDCVALATVSSALTYYSDTCPAPNAAVGHSASVTCGGAQKPTRACAAGWRCCDDAEGWTCVRFCE